MSLQSHEVLNFFWTYTYFGRKTTGRPNYYVLVEAWFRSCIKPLIKKDVLSKGSAKPAAMRVVLHNVSFIRIINQVGIAMYRGVHSAVSRDRTAL